jgi:hypothetical protein
MLTIYTRKRKPEGNSDYKNLKLGKIVKRYNIITAIIENYFISSQQFKGFEMARANQDITAHGRFGIKI